MNLKVIIIESVNHEISNSQHTRPSEHTGEDAAMKKTKHRRGMMNDQTAIQKIRIIIMNKIIIQLSGI